MRLKTALKEEQSVNDKKVIKAIFQTQENERIQVCRGLHDNVNQVLTTVKLLMDICLNEQADIKKTLQQATKLQQQSIDEIRRLSSLLSAPSLGNIGFRDSISELVHDIAKTSQLKVSFNAYNLGSLQVDFYVHLVVYRILQEHFTNLLERANATTLYVTMKCVKEDLVIEVKDDDQGVDTTLKNRDVCFQSMKMRADSVDGSLILTSTPAVGCTLIIKMPFKAENVATNDFRLPN